MTYYYHGTDRKSIENIITERTIKSDYFDNLTGCYITKNLEHASNHGNHVIKIHETQLDKSKFYEDNVNDGILYLGGINIDQCKCEVIMLNDKRTVRDFIGIIMEDTGIKTTKIFAGLPHE